MGGIEVMDRPPASNFYSKRKPHWKKTKTKTNTKTKTKTTWRYDSLQLLLQEKTRLECEHKSEPLVNATIEESIFN